MYVLESSIVIRELEQIDSTPQTIDYGHAQICKNATSPSNVSVVCVSPKKNAANSKISSMLRSQCTIVISQHYYNFGISI